MNKKWKKKISLTKLLAQHIRYLTRSDSAFWKASIKKPLFVENEIIVELKYVETLSKAHEVQLVNYLNGMKKDIGLLINFNPNGVDDKRKYRKPKKV